ncbi:hypothetical protein E1293_20745 [Actinomadura darangshiensis]|uniref:Tox-PL domain-containing protein n=1 Tax=Actinomadura darangshiensis TaxID=705336 RepID=A0A4R5B3V4_9ACTN|nr:toxin glutamine deamidase domain-containing protein [Actinomadura darangshiensis]TDD80441.1 hypothetical protein E1293_20745 [Actinomadura darangshiensis]
MSDDLIVPEAIPAPPVHLGDLEIAGQALKKGGRRVGRLGHDVDAAWQGLAGCYRAPETRLLLRATRQVASHGRAIENELAAVGDALLAFVDEVRPIVARLHGLRAAARDFRAEIDSDWDGDFGGWRSDGENVDKNNKFNNDVLSALAQYQEAERACANRITALFGGTRFVPSGPFIRRGQEGYGLGGALKDVKTPWGTPQQRDKPWYEDVHDGITGFGAEMGTFFGDLAGLHGEDGWYWHTGVGRWWGNIKGNYPRILKDLGYQERSLTTRRGWVELAHSFVPWREWDDRPGYVITYGGLHTLSLLAGMSLIKIKRGPKGIDLFPDKGLGGKIDRPADLGDLNSATPRTLDHINVGDLAEELAKGPAASPLIAAGSTLDSARPPPHSLHDPTSPHNTDRWSDSRQDPNPEPTVGAREHPAGPAEPPEPSPAGSSPSPGPVTREQHGEPFGDPSDHDGRPGGATRDEASPALAAADTYEQPPLAEGHSGPEHPGRGTPHGAGDSRPSADHRLLDHQTPPAHPERGLSARHEHGPIDPQRRAKVPLADLRPARTQMFENFVEMPNEDAALMGVAHHRVTRMLAQLGEGRPTTAQDVLRIIKEVNPTGHRRNCPESAMAVDDVLGGKPAVAGRLNGAAVPVARAAYKLRAIQSWPGLDGVRQIESIMRQAGSGSRAIIIGYGGKYTPHCYNVINVRGTLYYLDGQERRGWVGTHPVHDGRFTKFDLYRTG